MTDKIATEAEVLAAIAGPFQRVNEAETLAVFWASYAITAIRALGVLLPEEAAALRADAVLWEAFSTKTVEELNSAIGQRDALAARLTVLCQLVRRCRDGSPDWSAAFVREINVALTPAAGDAP